MSFILTDKISGSVEIFPTHIHPRRPTKVQMSSLPQENPQSAELQRPHGKPSDHS